MTAQLWNGLRRGHRYVHVFKQIRLIHVDGRNRLSNFWAPTAGITHQVGEEDVSHNFLIQGGFLRKAHSGVFHLLPLGLRVQDKLERLIDKHMQSLGASRLSLSSITTEALWKQSGRYSANSELLRLEDRKDSGFLLSPTHEEEITSLVKGIVHSYKDLPLRLYQIGRKYRDERRPRQGLLRAKEFLMKDLYTFDSSSSTALDTYEDVRSAYKALFDELRIPYLVADANSGAMGGNLSHEYHFISPKGEDNVWSCNNCSYIANEELVEKRTSFTEPQTRGSVVFTGISNDRTTGVYIHLPADKTITTTIPHWSQLHTYVNLHSIKSVYPDLDTGLEPTSISKLITKTTKTVHIYDHRVDSRPTSIQHESPHTTILTSHPKTHGPIDLSPIHPNSPCPRCDTGTLDVQRAIEVGHTFHLGTRYSKPLDARIAVPDKPQPEPMHMGCHGIGVSRIIGATASLLSDSRGLNWPRAIAPFEVVILSSSGGKGDADELYDGLVKGSGVDTIIDDRSGRSLVWKLRDADLIGYPVIVVLGRRWEERIVEVQCRRLGYNEYVEVQNLMGTVKKLLQQL